MQKLAVHQTSESMSNEVRTSNSPSKDRRLRYEDYCIGMGRKVAHKRKKRGLSQKQLAYDVGVSPSYIAKIERASGTLGTSLEVLFIIAEVLEIPLKDLFDLTVEDWKRAETFKMKRAYQARRIFVEFNKEDLIFKKK